MKIHEIKINKNIADIIEYINDLFDSSIKDNISDIHIETTREFILIRFRKD
jgi:type II secretory ATPase GspE/PulE/Tfp pilus assembly ATPase PilB-like protein